MGIESTLVAMGVSATTAAATATTVSALGTGLSLFSGVQSFMAGQQQSKLAIEQSKAQVAEQSRLAVREAAAETQAAEGVRRKQKLAYLASGVSLSGSPLMVMEETRRKGASNAQEIMSSADASNKATISEGSSMAKQLYTSGRNEFLKGVTGALTKYA